jgi:hypothetical protein
MSLLPPRKPAEVVTPHLRLEDNEPPPEDKLTKILEQLASQSVNAGLSASQLEAVLTKVGLSTAEGMRVSLKPENTEHRNESAFFTVRDKAKYGSWLNKPKLTRKTFFVGAEEKDERLMPEEIEGFNAITSACTARNGKWTAKIKKNGEEDELWVDVPCETVDNRMDLPSLILILHELNGGRSTADVHSLVKQIEALKRDAISRGASAGELEALLMAEG